MWCSAHYDHFICFCFALPCLFAGCCFCLACLLRTTNQIKFHCSSFVLIASVKIIEPIELGFYFCGSIDLMAYNGVPPKCAENPWAKSRKSRSSSSSKSLCFTVCRSIGPCGLSFSVHLFCLQFVVLAFLKYTVYLSVCVCFFSPILYLYANYKALKFHIIRGASNIFRIKNNCNRGFLVLYRA